MKSRSKKLKEKKVIKYDKIQVVNPFAKQHGIYNLEETPKAGVRRYRRLDSTQLEKYLLKEQITNRQYDAGFKLYTLYLQSGGSQRITQSYNELKFPNGDMSEKQVHAYHLMNKVLKDLGKSVAGCAFAVCCIDESANAWAVSSNISGRSGIDILRLGLDGIADYFKIT
ncbi:MAG: hypothetical protein GOVbin707_54 [Prokaryotic dsDNA virus sp.]|nr:MAG: hypothetical protein GOVbin707_54 [Prokaryotic dsDNA virus sp.]|tara:strand:- start:679 stop:1185 length:507 start_codon:yes stop_codon:yes gene_type:complete